ncbi:hypothetical protein HanIR_Chr06g0286511 [Helianthus annuus]|nr:hypothetical protein HanIR_Chr06g0286511 [Helianthus annuus]
MVVAMAVMVDVVVFRSRQGGQLGWCFRQTVAARGGFYRLRWWLQTPVVVADASGGGQGCCGFFFVRGGEGFIREKKKDAKRYRCTHMRCT